MRTHYIFNGITRTQVGQDCIHGDPRCTDHRSPVANFRVDFNSLDHFEEVGKTPLQYPPEWNRQGSCAGRWSVVGEEELKSFYRKDAKVAKGRGAGVVEEVPSEQ